MGGGISGGGLGGVLHRGGGVWILGRGPPTGLGDPLHVAVELALDLLLPPQLQEGASVLHPFPLFGEFPAMGRGLIWGGGDGRPPPPLLKPPRLLP